MCSTHMLFLSKNGMAPISTDSFSRVNQVKVIESRSMGTNDGMLVVKVTDSNGTTRRLLLDQPYTYVTL